MTKKLRRLAHWAGLALMVAALLVPAAGAQVAEGTEPQGAAGSRLVLLSRLDGPPLPEGLEILEEYGEAFVLARVSQGPLAALPPGNVMDAMEEATTVKLIGTAWDTRQGEPAIPDGLRSEPGDPYFLVQFYGPIKAEWLAGLEAMGASFLTYYPTYTYIVRMDPGLLEAVRAAHAVRWVGHYHPFYRLASAEELAKAETEGGKLAVDVTFFPGDDAALAQARLEASGVSIALLDPKDDGALVARVWASREQLPALARLPGVFRVEPYSQPRLHNDAATQVMHTRYLWKASRNGLLQDLMGAGQVAGMVDSGLDDKTTSPRVKDFYDYAGGTTTSRVVYNQNGAGCTGFCTCTSTDSISGHGTHVAGTIAGNGYLSLLQRGLTGHATAADPYFDYAWGAGQAPEAKIAVVHAGGTSGGICVSAQTDWTTLYNQGARAVNNSWGASTYSYGGNARLADYIMWNSQDYLIVGSGGNGGPGAGTIGQPANAKNILTVGAAGNHRSTWDTSQTSSSLTDFSSRGPVSTSGDTRFKPDIVAPGADVLSTRTTYIANGTIGLWQNEPGDGDGDGHLDYAWSGGTSMSSPQVTGAAIIVRDYYQDVQGLGSTAPPSAALLKATLVNGAVDMGYGYEANTVAYPYGGRNQQGWGMANLEQSLTPRAPRSFFYDDFTNITDTNHKSTIGPDGSGDYAQYSVAVADSSEPLKVTLTWTDYANTTNSSYAVNNLNLTVTSPGGTIYYGNNFTGSWSNSGGAVDSLNNTEAVYLQSPATGTWTVRVTLANAPTGTYQPFALVVSGGLGVTPSYARTCSGISSCTGRMGTSAQPYYPSLRPLTGIPEHLQAGDAFSASFRVTNWGTNADTISLSPAATDMSGALASGFTVTFSPAGPLSLASGASQDVQATVSAGSGVATGAYDVSLIATSAGSGARQDAQVLALNVVPTGSLMNDTAVGPDAVSTAGAQVSPAFWTCPSAPDTLWTAYLSGESHDNSAFEIWAARSTDGGATWTKWQVDANDGYHNVPPAISGSADCSSVTVAWAQERSASAWYLYTRTYSGGAWGAIGQRDAITGNSSASMNDVALAYDGDADQPDIVLVWWYYTGSDGTTGLRSAMNIDGTWSAASNLVVSANHRYPALAVDTASNHIWLAWSYAGTTRDIYVKYWNGNTDTWNGANTVAANTGNRENHPAIYWAGGRLWVAWNRYSDYSAAAPELCYTYSTSVLPAITWATAQGPYGTRLAEHTPPSITGNGSYTYVAYLGYDQTYAGVTPAWLRGANLYALKLDAASGAYLSTLQATATADDPPLYARGNAGSPRLQWATATVGTSTVTGPTLLYSKNPPGNGAPAYGTVGAAQALYNLEEDFDLYLGQLGIAPTAVDLVRFEAWPEGAGLHVQWETAQEIDNLGFNLYRSNTRTGARLRLNPELIPTLVPPGSPYGAVYDWIDAYRLRPGRAYFYWLEDVDLYGGTSIHGPLRVRTP
ncbi:MAG TPA: S8 family serine peptidase [Anaerolineae bacterium]|nr:S8 family serine peptidase [Anaerolineae bacterium]